jgi:hypothetical protein
MFARENAQPVFVIGPPQSGGEMVKWALGQHPDLLPLDESGWLAKFAGDLRTTFVLGKHGAQLPRMGISESEFFATFAASINELILRHARYDSPYIEDVDVRTPLRRYRSPTDRKTRWIDFSPEYSSRVYQLRDLFPQARFIHVLRDVREVAAVLTGLDKAASGQRSAEYAYGEWHRIMQDCVRAERAFGSDTVLRLRYDDLVSNPESILRRTLAFLGEHFRSACVEPIRYLAGESSVEPDTAGEESDSPVIAEAIAFSDELFSEANPEWEPNLDLQVELGAASAELVSLPVDGPMSQRGPATGFSDDRWVDGALTALFYAEDDIELLIIEGGLPDLPNGEDATLFLTINEKEFRETFPLGREISWAVPCKLRRQEHADLRLRSSRTVCPSKEGIGTDERDLLLCLYRLTFSTHWQDERPEAFEVSGGETA